MPRQIKDEYEILEEVGSGGMAVVYKALQKSLKRPVAIKELKKTYHSDKQIVLRFEREGMVAASLQHENIVHIYDYWKKPNHCIVMEHVDGVNLADVIARTGALPVDIALMIMVQVCSALDYAHMRGIIHRDIKPSNIMIKRNGEVKLMDFGIAHTREQEALTMPGTLIGTPAYMSPEQIIGQNLDIRSDIFSFGIVLYEVFTGIKPFVDEDTRAVSVKIMNDKIVRPRKINENIPRSVQRVIRKCLNKKPQKRFGSMLEIEKKLGKRLAGKTTKAVSLARIAEYLVSLKIMEAVPEQETLVITARPPKRRWAVPAVAAVLLLLFAAGALVYYQWTRSGIDVPVLFPKAAPASSTPQPVLVSRPQQTNETPISAPTPSDKGPLKSSVSGSQTSIQRVQTSPETSTTAVSHEQKKKQSSSHAGKKKASIETPVKKKKSKVPRQ